MGIRNTPIALLIGMLLSGHPQSSPAQSQTELRTWIEDSGSVPPVHQWFNCIHELEHKAYSKLKAQECLNSILSHPEFEKGLIAFNKRSHLLTFTVALPTLALPSLAIHPGDTNSHTRVSEQEKSLTESFQRTDSQIKVFTDVQIDSEGKATLDFSILAYPDDVVYINGKPYDVTARLHSP